MGDTDSSPDISRYQSVWWTLYILDRRISSLMGAPSSVEDGDVTASLPITHQSAQKLYAVDMHVKLSRLIAKILKSRFWDQSTLYLSL